MKTRIHVNQHKIRSNKKHNLNEPVITVKTSKSNDYGHEVEILGPSKIVYSPDKPLSCGAKVWIETRGDIELDGKKIASNPCNEKPVVINVPKNISAKGLVKVDFEFLRKKQRQIKNKNKLLAI